MLRILLVVVVVVLVWLAYEQRRKSVIFLVVALLVMFFGLLGTGKGFELELLKYFKVKVEHVDKSRIGTKNEISSTEE